MQSRPSDLFPFAAANDPVVARAISQHQELGAYEALWAISGTSFRSLAESFGAHPGAMPSDFVSPTQASAFADLALRALREAGIEDFGVHIHGTADYPAALRDAEDPVELLYSQGRWELVRTPCISVVGTREPTAAGQRAAAEIAHRCVAAGYTIVSGLARGIDTIAHTTAINAGGSTIAVLGTPLTECYPPENRALLRELRQKHLVLSQVPIVQYFKGPHKWRTRFFPARNITMSALSEATIIVEAGETSGTLIQAKHALKQRRPLFILDSCFQDPALTWPTQFQQLGAIRVMDYDDIRKHLATPPHSANAIEN